MATRINGTPGPLTTPGLPGPQTRPPTPPQTTSPSNQELTSRPIRVTPSPSPVSGATEGPSLPTTQANGPSLPFTNGPSLPTTQGNGPSLPFTNGPSLPTTPGNGPSLPQTNGPSLPTTMANGPSLPTTMANGPSLPTTMANGPSLPTTMANGPSLPTTMANGPSLPTTMANGPITSSNGPPLGSSPAGGPTGASTLVSGPSGFSGPTTSRGPSEASNPVSTTFIWTSSQNGQGTSMISGMWNSTVTEKSVFETLKSGWVIAVMSVGAALLLLLFAVLCYCLYRCCVTAYCPQQRVKRIVRRRIIRPEPEPMLVNRGQVLYAGPKLDPCCTPVTKIYQEPAETFSRHSVKLTAVCNMPPPAAISNGSCCQVYTSGSRFYDNRSSCCCEGDGVRVHEGGRGGARLYGPTVIEIMDNSSRGDRSNVTSYRHSGGYLLDQGDGTYDRIGGRRSGVYGSRGSVVGVRSSTYNQPATIIIGNDRSW